MRPRRRSSRWGRPPGPRSRPFGVALLLLAACSSAKPPAGAGGQSTGSGDPCIGGAECSSCTDRASCFSCNTVAHQAGVAAYDALLQCILCDACYTTCDGAMTPMVCPTPPASPDACDGTAANAVACTGGTMNCEICATQGTCKAAFSTCEVDADCKALLIALPECPAE